MTERRTTAERVTFAVSAALLLAIVAVIVLQLFGDETPPAPVATVERVRLVADRYHVTVKVDNEGDQTAASVQVTAELDVAGQTSTGDQTIDFLAGGEEARVAFVFDDDPGDGELTVVVSGYTIP